MKNAIQLTRTYQHPIEQVWQALTDRQALSEWLMPCDFEPLVGHEFTFRTTPSPGFDGVVHCRVLELRAPELLSFSWQNGKLNTQVTFRLTEQAGATRLDFEHAGFTGLLQKLIVRNLLGRGWKKQLLSINLPKYLRQ